MSRLVELTTRHRLIVAAGGVGGAVLRWLIIGDDWLQPSGLPWTVLAVNVTACLVLGTVVELAPAARWSTARADALTVGVCGGLSTYSTFTVEVVQLARDGSEVLAAAYVALTLTATIVAIFSGRTAARSWYRRTTGHPTR